MKKTNGLRGLIIRGMTRQQQIDFVKRKAPFYIGTSFAELSDKQVLQIALSIDKQVQANKRKIKTH